MDEPLKTLQRRWDATCKILLGEPIGNIHDYKEWLLESTEPMRHAKSSISGKEVSYATIHYDKNSKWISFDEIDFTKNYSSPNLDAKNTTELLSSISDIFYYAGNIVLGKCGEIEKSSNIQDSFYAYSVGKMVESKYWAYCFWGRLSEDCYGCNGLGNASMVLKCNETFFYKRCFEVWMSQHATDCYYSYGLTNCSDCMFCFHLKGKRYCIGNTQLTPEKYGQIKQKLVSQMLAHVKKHKRLPSLAELAKNSKLDKTLLEGIKLPEKKEPKKDISAIEDGFKKACKLILGKELPGSIDDYGDWLKKHKRKTAEFKSAISKKSVFMGDYCACFELPKDRLIGSDETTVFAESAKLSEQEIYSLDFEKITEVLGKIAYFSPEYYEGSTSNIIGCPTALDATNCYKSLACVWAKNTAYGCWPRSSEHIYGFDSCLSSQFCINCYESVNLKRCFEMDNCRDSSDCYFCHNIENCENCMFCFNVKAKHYAIGNAEVGKEKYEKVKKIVLGEIVQKLEKGKKLDLDIYNLGRK